MVSMDVMVQKIDSYFGEENNVLAAYLFGSFARGRQHAMSDVDIAVLLDERKGRIDRKILLDRLHQNLGRLLRLDIHLLILNDASYTAGIEALFRGRCVHVKDEEASAHFKMLTLSQYADFAPVRERLHGKLRQRLGVNQHG